MKHFSMALAALALASVLQPARTSAQGLDPLNPIPGGATGANAICIQVGDLNSGAFVGLFAQPDGGKWEEKAYAKPGATNYEETRRSEEAIEIFNSDRPLAIQFDFVRKKVRSAPKSGSADWTDLYYILNATDKEGAGDCLMLASRLGTAAAAAAAAGGGSLAGAGAGGGGRRMTLIQNITVRPGILIAIPPGTQLTATNGPPCPGQPGFFLCPNRFSCAPVGGVCCPGVGACAPGTFCDRFIPNACIGPGDPRFCPGTGDPVTGISLHCAVGSVCLPGNICNP